MQAPAIKVGMCHEACAMKVGMCHETCPIRAFGHVGACHVESMFEPLPMVELMLLTIGGARRANIAKSVEMQ